MKRRVPEGEGRVQPWPQPLAPAWQTAPVLHGPHSARHPFGDPVERELRRAAAARKHTLPAQWRPRVTLGMPPPVKRLLGLVAMVAQCVEQAGPTLRAQWCASGRARPDGDGWLVEMDLTPEANPVSLAAPVASASGAGSAGPVHAVPAQPNDEAVLDRLALRLIERIQALRRHGVAHGRWWPAPDRLRIRWTPDGRVSAGLRLPEGYRPPDQPWLDWPPGPRTAP